MENLKRMKIILFIVAVLGMSQAHTLVFKASAAQKTSPALPKVVVVIGLRSPDFLVRNAGFRGVYATFKDDRIPLNGFDFKAALTDELMHTLAEDKRMQWRLITEADGIDLRELMDNKKASVPVSLDADRLLLVDILEYGAVINPFYKKACYITINIKLLDKVSGKKLWSETFFGVKVNLPKNLDELQADNQKGLKEVLNQAIEQLSQMTLKKLREKSL